MVDAQLGADFDIVKRESVYLPNFLAASNDFKIMNQLTADLEHEQHGMINWSQHLKHENPEFSATFLRIITQMQVRRCGDGSVIAFFPYRSAGLISDTRRIFH